MLNTTPVFDRNFRIVSKNIILILLFLYSPKKSQSQPLSEKFLSAMIEDCTGSVSEFSSKNDSGKGNLFIAGRNLEIEALVLEVTDVYVQIIDTVRRHGKLWSQKPVEGIATVYLISIHAKCHYADVDYSITSSIPLIYMSEVFNVSVCPEENETSLFSLEYMEASPLSGTEDTQHYEWQLTGSTLVLQSFVSKLTETLHTSSSQCPF